MSRVGVRRARPDVAPAGPGRGGGFSVAIWLIALVASAPLAVAVLSFVVDTGDVWPHLLRYVLPEALLNTLALVAGVGVIALVLGVSLAWFVATCEFPGRRVFRWALLLPMAMPGYVLGFAFAALFEYTGPVQSAWRTAFGANAPFPGLGAAGASIVTLGLVLYPYVFLIARQAFSTQGVRSLEVARSCGIRPLRGFFRVSLPMARPFIVAGLSLAAMECLADFGTVQLFNYTTFTTAIYRSWYGLYSLQSALQLSVVLVGLVLVALLLEKRLRGASRYTATGGTVGKRLELSPLARLGVSAWCSTVLAVAFLLPAGLILKWSIESFASEFDQRYFELAGNTLLLASFAALMITGLALLLGFSVRRAPTAANRVLSRLATLGYAIPGTVLAVGFFVPVAYLSRVLNSTMFAASGTTVALQGGLSVLFLAYLARYLAVAHNPVEGALTRIRPSIEDAARGMGVSGLKLLRKVHVPMLKPALVTALLLVFVDVMKELPITLMTRPFGWDTLAVRVFQLTTEGQWRLAALPALAIVIAGLIPVSLLSRRTD